MNLHMDVGENNESLPPFRCLEVCEAITKGRSRLLPYASLAERGDMISDYVEATERTSGMHFFNCSNICGVKIKQIYMIFDELLSAAEKDANLPSRLTDADTDIAQNENVIDELDCSILYKARQKHSMSALHLHIQF
ncbi:hypothetical protein EG68_06405 [Paragonimus skrjabini miyazakii]|uniref:Uncharacterized protein n=1 Tax=Paragonimus skrjabini miyazakii TaxID=59628 RepID=A0A8S9YMT3_9TREM|nr:hypothetical protein EG68_06405 [Paragonimus skrjabini miyazakii]